MNTILLAFAGFFALFKAVERKNAWAGMTLNNWNSLDNATKDFVQQAVSVLILDIDGAPTDHVFEMQARLMKLLLSY